jgi:hypothetical protein
MSDYWTERGEKLEQRECRLAMCACLNADVIYRDVRDGLCYFEVYLTDDPEGPKVALFIPTEELTSDDSTKAARADVQSLRPLCYGSYVERVLYHLWRPACAAGDPLAYLSHRWPRAKPQALLRILRGEDG